MKKIKIAARIATQKNALITGASSGIGLELARLFSRDGVFLVLKAEKLDPILGLQNE